MAPAGLVEWQQHQGKPRLSPEQETWSGNTALVLPALWRRQDTVCQARAVSRELQREDSLSPTSPWPRARPAIGKGQMLSDVTLPPQIKREERSSLHGTGRGGEEGREGRTTTAPGRQTACSVLPWSLELPEGRCPKAGARCCQPRAQQGRVSCSARWATPASSPGDGVAKDPQQAGRWAEPP